MQQQKPRSLLAYMLLCSLLIVLTAGHQNHNAAWKYNDPHFDAAQYAKIFGQATGNANGNAPGQEQYGPFQYQYVDHQPNCREGGQPVCATNGNNYFYFENDCKLEAHNMQLLFQHGTELEPTEIDNCMPNCGNIKCNNVYQPVCAAAESGPHKGQGVTFANECVVRRRECTTKETMRFLNKGPCRSPRSKLRSKGKRKHTHNRNKSSTSRTIEVTEAATTASPVAGYRKVYVMSTTAVPAPTRSTSSTTTTTTTTPAPMRFHQVISNSDVSVSRAVNPYSVFDIPDVGTDYDAIKDSSLSLYLPGIGTVTDTPPSTTTTTTTPAPTTTTSTTTTTTTARPSTSPVSTTAAPATTSTTAKSIINIIYVPYKVTPTTSATPILSVSRAKSNIATSSAKPSTTSTTIATGDDSKSSSTVSVNNSASTLTINSTGNHKRTIDKPNMNSSTTTTPSSPIVLAQNATAFTANPERSTKPIAKPMIIKTEESK